MGKIYERKTDRQSWGKHAMIEAVAEVVNNKKSVNSVAKKYFIPEATLRRYLKKSGGAKKLEEKDIPQNAGRWKKTFNDDQFKELKDYIIAEADKREFGLTRTQFGRLCYDFAERQGINHRFNKQKMTAGKDFIAGFIKDCSLSLRAPEAKSLARFSTFNSVSIKKFFNTLRELRIERKSLEANISNVDGTESSTVPTRDLKVLPPQENRRVIMTEITHEKETEIHISNNDPDEINSTSDLPIPGGAPLLSDNLTKACETSNLPPLPTMKGKMSKRQRKILPSKYPTGSPVKSVLLEKKKKDKVFNKKQQLKSKKVEVRKTQQNKPIKIPTKMKKLAR